MYRLNYSSPGAQAFVDSWAAQYASWGVDYLKIDGVDATTIDDIQAWASALRKTGRPITFALSNNLPIANAATWEAARQQLADTGRCGVLLRTRPKRQRLSADDLVPGDRSVRLRRQLAAVGRSGRLE
ncbi:alpha-amylase family protein [Fodinicola feengrottensis]|uniref:hypothetical protein n=1 Tax=Fodinicola feengrottensis TaxID=435914 RepID=UPI002442B993|nr:hypothetical protein [Fodinicola feengrottensis]